MLFDVLNCNKTFLRKQVNTFLEAFSDATIAVKTFLITLVFFLQMGWENGKRDLRFSQEFFLAKKSEIVKNFMSYANIIRPCKTSKTDLCSF